MASHGHCRHGRQALRPMIVVTDSQNLADTVHSDAGSTNDKRFRIVVAMLREGFTPAKESALKWENTHKMLADGLTKNLGDDDAKTAAPPSCTC